jgi:hypothetical protein
MACISPADHPATPVFPCSGEIFPGAPGQNTRPESAAAQIDEFQKIIGCAGIFPWHPAIRHV